MTLLRPLNEAATREADDAFYRNHPEMVKDGVRQPIDSSDPEQESLRKEWINSYLANGGQQSNSGLRTKEDEPDETDAEVTEGDSVAPSPVKREAAKAPRGEESKAAIVPCPLAEDEKLPEPRIISAKWSKPMTTPVHNKNWPPATPPTDDIPEECKVYLLIDTEHVPEGSSATIEIYHCHTDTLVKNGTIENLVVKGNSVNDPVTGTSPLWVFEYDHVLWDPWDTPYYYFKATVAGLKTETPKDYKTMANETLQLKYLHVCVSDAVADSPAGGGLTTRAEMYEIASILSGTSANHKTIRQVFNARRFPYNVWGSVIRNTYTYHHASHGNIVDRTTGRGIITNSNPPTRPVGNWRSVIILGNMNMGDNEITNAGDFPSTPKYLAYLDTCVAGWERSFADAFLARGTAHVIAFRKFIPDNDARSMARRFHKEWKRKHNCNPDMIPDIFAKFEPRYRRSMRPVLFSAPPGPDVLDLALKAIEEILIGL